MKLLLIALCVAAASAGSWSSICTLDKEASTPCPTIMMGVGCANSSWCQIVGGYSNTPEGVYYSQDQFATYNRANMEKDSVLLLDIAVQPDGTACTAGVGLGGDPGILHTANGKDWLASSDKDFMQGQSMTAMHDGWFAYVGTTSTITNTQGALISKDGGSSWSELNWPASLNNLTAVRYGAFPAGDSWYIAGGQWPAKNKLDVDCHRINAKTCLKMPKNFQNKQVKRETMAQGYYAVMSKSTDQGKSWENIHHWAGEFYFNGMDCFNSLTCMVTGEGFQQDGSSKPGGRILGTTDGGKTWTEILFNGAPQASMGDVKYVSETEAWAAGSETSKGGLFGVIYHTTDGGKTWTKESLIAGVGDIPSIDVVGNTGFAVGITEFQVATMLVKK